MRRFALDDLLKWKEKKGRKPLVLRGARQVGKTWILREFGRLYYDKVAYINFDDNKRMTDVFSGSLDIERIISALKIETNINILAEDTLIIFDEIQEVPRALSSLKYFCENAPQYHIVAAGSLLGVALHTGTSFPVGKVDFLDLYPLSFKEFLIANGEEQLSELLSKQDFEMINAFSEKYIDLLRNFYFVGGMPEVVVNFAENKDFIEVREIQNKILSAYEQDFSKHAPNEIVPRIRMLWKSVPSQLSKENKKFIYGLIKEGARAREYELAMLWLQDCGLVHKVSRVTSPQMPLKAYEDMSAFKLFIVDVGLLCAMVDLEPKVIIDGNKLFTEFKGAFTEQFVLQQIKSDTNLTPFYWSAEKGKAEIDFLLQIGVDIVPVEVKAEVNLQAKSLKSFRDKFSPHYSVRISMANFERQDWLINLPLYAISEIADLG